ncbi:hypothetical protein D9Q98_008059 [Chlorella vulgaris]|uniref:Lys-63-specific deubiquitinase ZUFSP n=1 Tax=Chlorella vulgaris TaxID=3077 RepID=A0A9D4YU45_CHLVU|nr:hypothetical protein D9Q98_008059 [Chlorella vulgaris]
MGDCPLCGRRFDACTELQAHAETHFQSEKAPARAKGPAAVRCSKCGTQVAAEEAASHALAHSLELEEQQQLAAAGCAADRAAEALDGAAAAALAAAEWDEDAMAAEDAIAAADAAHLEELYFEQLRSRYGFAEQPVREGCCRLCGQQGHWASDCERNPDKQAAAARVLPTPLPRSIMASQQRAHSTQLRNGASLEQLLAACLEQQQLPASVSYQARLCGTVQHFGASHYSAGWGCGWNNIQMLASHLLEARPAARRVLFGGVGWVPDISGLQAWLEAAWQLGFDVQGAEQLDGCVQGTKKWVGTTECAALLRSFGLRAQIVDFGVAQQQQQQAASAASAGAGLSRGARQVPVHPGVACDACGQCPILGDRYKSETLLDYDLCSGCHSSMGGSEAAAGPFRLMLPGAVRVPAQQQQAQGQQGQGRSMTEQLLCWVWRYFMAEEEGEAPSSASGSGSGSQAGPDAGAGAGGPSAKRQRPARVRLSGKAPLYLQHEGHSRTIVGIERRLVGREQRAEFTLLILDPSTPGSKLAAALANRTGWQRLLKRGAHTLRNQQYQLLFVEPGIAAGAQLDALKMLAAVERYS